MNNFWKNTFSAFVGSGLAMIVVAGLFLIIVFATVGSIIAGLEGDKKAAKVGDETILLIKLDRPIIERANENDFQFDFTSFNSEPGIGLNHLLKDIDKASDDDRVKGIHLDLTSVMASPSSLQDIRNALQEFRDEGKWITAYGEVFTQGAYYIASVANEVYMYPEGGMDWRGLNAELIFFKKMLEKLDIDMQVIRGKNNKFKSAVEPFLYDEMSEANREQTEKFLGTIWDQITVDIGLSRDLSPEFLNMLADSLIAFEPEMAVEKGLIDGLKYSDEMLDMLKGKIEMEEDDELKLLAIGDYHSAKLPDSKDKDDEDSDDDDEDKPSWKKDRVAVVYAVGGIESGEGDDETIGSDRIAGALREAREDEKVKAVVLRVNSPGGSALASDVIWRETKLIKESGKPFVVSMGDVAASGGYYISAAADKIFANNTTITGSIGVFGMLPMTERFFENKMGITFDNVATNAHSGLATTNRPLDEFEYGVIQESVERVYDTFIGIVAEGRNMSKADVDAIGQGRVWAGKDAMELGLVDEIGNLEDAIEAAAELAELDDYRTKDYPKLIDPMQQLLEELQGKEAAMVKSHLGEYSILYDEFKNIENMIKEGGVQARLPYILRIK